MALPFPIGLLHDPQQAMGFVCLIVVLTIAGILNFADRVSRRVSTLLTSIAVVLAFGSSFRLATAPNRVTPAPIFYPDGAQPALNIGSRLS